MQVNLPQCYGKEWEANAPECAGGLDPAFTDPKNGSHIRQKCPFYDSCGARTRIAANGQTTVVPIQQQQQVFRPTAPLLPPPSLFQPKPTSPGLQSVAQAVQAASMASHQVRPPIMPVVPTVHHSVVGQTYPQYMALDFRMPSYLTVPEPVMPGDTVWSVLGRELIRAGLKAFGHALASFVDRTILRRNPPPTVPPNT